MKTHERTRLDADAKAKQAEGAKKEIDLRAGQIEKLQQEIAFYRQEEERYLREQQELMARADQEERDEERAEEKKREEIAFNTAIAMQNNNT